MTDRDAVAAALPSYEIGDELGRGGWGVVLAGRHRSTRPSRRHQATPARVRQRSRGAIALRRRGPDAGVARPSAHRAGLRLHRARRPVSAGDGATGRGHGLDPVHHRGVRPAGHLCAWCCAPRWRWSTRTATGCCTATSSRRTCCSPATEPRSRWRTSGSPVSSRAGGRWRRRPARCSAPRPTWRPNRPRAGP